MEDLNPKERYLKRLLELAKVDTQLKEMTPDVDVREKAKLTDSYDETLSVFFGTYKERPFLGGRKYEVKKDFNTGQNVKKYLNEFETISYNELHNSIKGLSMAWRIHPECQVQRNDFVLVIGFADIQYAIVDFAITYSKAVTVPVQSSTSTKNLVEIIDTIAPSLIAATIEDIELAAKLAEHKKSVKSLVVFNYDDRIDGNRNNIEKARKSLNGKSLFILSNLMEFGEKEVFTFLPNESFELEKPAAIIHSSGSTGKPKGAVITQKSFIGELTGAGVLVPTVTVLLAPLNHMLGRKSLSRILKTGGTGYFTLMPDMSTLLKDLRLARPTFLSLFPRILELIYQHYQNEVVLRHIPGKTNKEAIEKQVRQEMRSNYLGNRILCITFGSAPTTKKVQNFIKECFDVLIIEGYGSTESGLSGLALNGKILKDVVTDFGLRDVPELGYYSTDKPYPRGEFVYKSRYGIREYYNQPKATAALFDNEGFSRTGDIVELIDSEEIKIIDRIADVLKLSHGEYVALGVLGTLFESGSAVIKQMHVYGNSKHSYLLAVIVPEQKMLENMIGENPMEVQIKNLLRDELHKVAKKEKLKKFEVPLDFILEHEEFTYKNGLLSSLRKRLRPAFKMKYGDRLETIYDNNDQEALENNQIAALKDANLTTIEKLIILLESQLKIKGIKADSERNFSELGGDSIGAVFYSTVIEKTFNVALPADIILSPTGNIKKWAMFIDTNKYKAHTSEITFNAIHQKGSNQVHQNDLKLDKFIAADVLKEAASLPTSPNSPKTVLLTGANGFLGHIVCLEWLNILSKNNGKLICIIRENTDQAAFDKLAKEYQGLDPALEKLFNTLSKKTLEVVAGDISLPSFGLRDEKFDLLAKEVDRICHIAALVNHRLSYQNLFRPNVFGTAEIIRFSLTKSRKPIDFISSVGVFMLLDASGEISEKTPFKQEIILTDDYAVGYAASKWAGELLLKEVNQRFGNPVNIFRCNMIMPHQHYKGQTNTADILTRLLYSIVITGLAPQSFYNIGSNGKPIAGHYKGIPVDILSKTIVGAHTLMHQNYTIYHGVNYLDDTICLDRFVDWIYSSGYDIKRIQSYKDWHEQLQLKLSKLPEESRKLSILQLIKAFEKPSYGEKSKIDASNFKKLISALGDLYFPSLSESYIHKYLSDMRLLKMIPKPKERV